MKTFKQAIRLLAVMAVGFGLLAVFFTQLNLMAKAAPVDQLNVDATGVYTTLQTTNKQPADTSTITTSSTAWRYKTTFGVTEEPYIIDSTHHDAPFGITVDGSDNVWVTELDGGRVLKFNSSGVYQSMLGRTGIKRDFGPYLVQPVATAVDSSGNGWVTDRETHRVKKYDSAGAVLLTLGEVWTSGDDNAHFNWPHGAAIDSSDNVYIADRNNHRVQIFDSSGVYLATIGESGVSGADDAHFDGPVHIAIDNSDQLYVADRQNERVQVFDVSNPAAVMYVGTLGTTGAAGSDNAHFNGPFGVTAVNGKIYVADLGNDRVQIFNAATYAYLATIGGTEGAGNNQFQSAIDVAVDSNGTIYVADVGNNRVQVFNSSYAYVRTMGVAGVPYVTDDNHYYQPFHVDATMDGGWLVAEQFGHRVIKLNADGSQAWTIGETGIPGDDQTHFNLPHDVAEHSNRVVFITDAANHRLMRFDPYGSYLGEWGGYGTGDYQYNWPTAVAFAPNGDILVVDANNQRVQVYDFNFFYKTTLGVTGVSGSDNAHFSNPLDVAVDANGSIYVADVDNHRVQVFNSSYIYQKTIGITGDCGIDLDNAHLCGPHGLDFDAQGRLYVVDTWHQRVQIFDPAGNYLSSIGNNYGGQPGQFRSPSGVAVSASGQVLVSDTENHRLQLFEPYENTWGQVNANGFGNGNNGFITALEVWGDSLFAGASNWEEGGSVWWYDTSVPTWTQVSEPGFSATYTNTNGAVIDLAVFNNYLYASTGWSENVGQLWRSSNGTSWMPVSTDGLGNSNNIALTGFGEYNGYLYLGTNNNTDGAEIWRSQTGNPGEWSRVFTGGGDNVNNHIANSFLEFDGYFYVSCENDDQGMTIWRTSNGTTWTQVNSDGFGDADNTLAGGLAEFNGYLYIGTRNDITGAQLWRSSNGTTWEQVIGEGFGDLNNVKIETAVMFANALYVATENNETGMEVWRSGDGVHFVQVNQDGFSGRNTGTLWSSGTAVYQNNLYMGTSNWDDGGGSIWMTPPSYDAFLPMIVK